MDAQPPLLSVRDLSVAFRQGERQTARGRPRLVRHRARARRWRWSANPGSGKSVTALSVLKLLPYPAAQPSVRHDPFKGQDLLDAAEREMRQVRGNDITMIFQEPMTSLNPLHTIEQQIGEICAYRDHGGAQAHHRISRRWHSRSDGRPRS